MIIFVHIPKSAGTSFNRMIERNFSYTFDFDRGMEKWSINNRNILDAFLDGQKIGVKPDYCRGHFAHGFHNIFEYDLEFNYITFLRNPVERTISAIRFCADRMPSMGLFGDDEFHKAYNLNYKDKNNKRGAISFLEVCLEKNMFGNVQVKQLSGLANLKNISLNHDEQISARWFSPYHREFEPYSESQMQEMLDAAIDNVEKYAFVGFKEDMSGSLGRFESTFPDLKLKRHRSRFKSSKSRYFNGLTKKAYVLLNEMNKYDIKLCEHFRRKT